MSYAEVRARSIALANGMASRGIERGFKVGVLSQSPDVHGRHPSGVEGWGGVGAAQSA